MDKRKDAPGGAHGKDKKRAKVHAARSIDIQQRQQQQQRPPSSLPHGSTSIETSSGSSNVPRTLDVVAFTEARAFEINAMHHAMERSRDSAAQRAFQSLPRNLRRRAASHNIKRLPVRLRDRANKEVSVDQVKPGKKPDNRYKKRRSGALAEQYLKRQKSKRWLETHVWHAKRAKMVDLWGYKLADHSNENGIKSAYRSSHHQCILQDLSYFGCLEIEGDKQEIGRVLNRMMDPMAPSVLSKRHVRGNRLFDAFLYSPDRFPLGLLAPVTMLWKALAINGLEATEIMQVDGQEDKGRLWIWVHPSAFEQVQQSIKESVANLPKSGKTISVSDLENDLVRFDFTGPRSTAILQAVLQLTPNPPSQNMEAHKVWDSLASLRSTASLPPGVVLGLEVYDPRLSFPHNAKARAQSMEREAVAQMTRLVTNWPSDLAVSGLWNKERRMDLLASKSTEAQLNQRREQNLVPGTKLQPVIGIDKPIPVLLIQRDGQASALLSELSPSASTSRLASSSSLTGEYQSGWTLILPKGYGMAFWKSFIFAGVKFGGMRERRSFHFETRQSCFPYDFPTTAGYLGYATAYKAEKETKYGNIPVAKRPNYSKLGVEDPFGADWVKCLSIAGTGAETAEAMEVDKNDETTGKDDSLLWVLQTPKLVEALQKCALQQAPKDQTSLVGTLNKAIQQILSESLVQREPSSLIDVASNCKVENALIRVGVEYLGRGTSVMNGMIFPIPLDKYGTWAARSLQRGKRTAEGERRYAKKEKSWLDDSEDDDDDDSTETESMIDLELDRPAKESLLGYITTGQYCYSQGKSFAIGCCSAVGLAQLMATEQSWRTSPSQQEGQPGIDKRKVPSMMVLIRGTTSKVSRLAKISILQ